MSFNETMYEVLRRSKYDKLMGRRNGLSRALENALRRLADLFPSDAAPSGEQFDITPILTTISIIVVIVLSVAVIIAIVFALRRLFSKKGDAVADVTSSAKHDLSADDTLRDAKNLAERGDFLGALRRGHAALLIALRAKKFITRYESKTDGQLRRELEGAAPACVPGFKRSSNAFCEAFFGAGHMDAETLRDYIKNVETLIRKGVSGYD
ncbi:MAG: hypothetical protein LBL35_02390 [Clostridiales bacterium]|nr:hypothetical protein [Clostridiales bacterium]